jgi:hypothetical protein
MHLMHLQRSIVNRVVIDFSLKEQCLDDPAVFSKHRELHKNNQSKEYYYLHTSREKLGIEERKWVSIRIDNTNPASL